MGKRTPEREADAVLFTGIVVTCNEERYLRDCLGSLSFCDELLVVDLGSTDASVSIAREAGAKVLRHERVPVVEKVREYAMRQARNDWIIFLDPDEVMPPALADKISEAARDPRIAAIKLPWQFYFKEKPLTCCIWGIKNNSKVFVVHRNRIILKPLVHKGYESLPGYEVIDIPRTEDNFIRHYWMRSWGQLIEKHRRYIGQEGESRHKSGQRFSWRRALTESRRALTVNLFDHRGLLGGLTGISLSLFYCWYVFMSHMSLRKYGRGQKVKTVGE